MQNQGWVDEIGSSAGSLVMVTMQITGSDALMLSGLLA